jgi:hypothetical protein
MLQSSVSSGLIKAMTIQNTAANVGALALQTLAVQFEAQAARELVVVCADQTLAQLRVT